MVVTFPETFDTIQQETGLKNGEIRDDITHLIHSGHLVIFEETATGELNKVFHYDTDNLKNYMFRTTRKGQAETILYDC